MFDAEAGRVAALRNSFTQLDGASVLALPHPSATGTLPEHTFWRRQSNEFDGQDTWYSVTEISHQRICVDLAVFRSGHRSRMFEFDEAERGLRAGHYTLVGPSGREAPFELAEQRPRAVFGRHRGLAPIGYRVDTGRSQQVCVEDQVNQYGNVVGCRRYEEQPLEDTVYRQEEVELFSEYGGVRMCAKNEGIVGPTSTWFGLQLSWRNLRVDLQGGVAKAGPWGAVGGRSALAPWPGQGGTERAPTPPAPAASGADPAPGEAALLEHRGGRLEVVPFTIRDPRGKVVLTVGPDGKMTAGRKVVGWVLTDGVARGADHHATHVYDRGRVVWTRSHDGKVRKVGRLEGNRAQIGLQALTVRDGVFVLHGVGSKPLLNRASPADAPAELLLFAAVATNGVYLGLPPAR